MSSLLDNARRGLDIPLEQHEVQEQATRVHWRTCVHSLNIIRLLVLDAALGNDMVFYFTPLIYCFIMLTISLYHRRMRTYQQLLLWL